MRRTCWTIADVDECLHRAAASRVVAYDVESCPNANTGQTSALRPEFGARVAGHGLAWLEDDVVCSCYMPIRHDFTTMGNRHQLPTVELTEKLDAFFVRYPGRVVVANASMELSFMLTEGIHWPLPGFLDDVQVMARVLNKGVGLFELIGLKELAIKWLGKNLESEDELDRWLKSQRMKPGRDIWRGPVALVSEYCQDDCRYTLGLWQLWQSHLIRADQPRSRWWWYRQPDKSTRHDLYELEMETVVGTTMSSMGGTRYDAALCKRRARAATALQLVADSWIKDRLGMPTLSPGSPQQMKGVIFTNLGFRINPDHMTDKFVKKSSSAEQEAIIARIAECDQRSEASHTGDGPIHYSYPPDLVDYASLDVEALSAYAIQRQDYSDLLFMCAVRRKCTTAITWFYETVLEFGQEGQPDPWWNAEVDAWVNTIFHRLRSVGTVSGRMSSVDYNSQQCAKRMKMLISAATLRFLLEGYLSDDELAALWDLLDFTTANNDDEAKAIAGKIGAVAVNFSVREMFIARPGKFFRSWDLSQVEMRGFAHYTGNKMLCEGYGRAMADQEVDEELGLLRQVAVEHGPFTALKAVLQIRRHGVMDASTFDIHKFIGDHPKLQVGRKKAKGINFGIVYGMGRRKLGRQLGWSPREATKFLGMYNDMLPEIGEVQAQIKVRLRQRGYVFDPYGRRYYLSIDRSYVALNRLIQGWAASAFKHGFVRIIDLFSSPALGGKFDPIMRRWRMDQTRLLKAVHDENLAEVPESLDTEELDLAVRSCMTAFHGLRVPLASSSERSPITGGAWDGMEAITAQL